MQVKLFRLLSYAAEFPCGKPLVFVNMTSGLGAPSIFNSILIGSPALNFNSLTGPNMSLRSNLGFSILKIN